MQVNPKVRTKACSEKESEALIETLCKMITRYKFVTQFCSFVCVSCM